jgi:hypothetical protein
VNLALKAFQAKVTTQMQSARDEEGGLAPPLAKIQIESVDRVTDRLEFLPSRRLPLQ